MVKPIIPTNKNVENNWLGEGPCVICGRIWTFKDVLPQNQNPIDRYLNGAPKTDVLNYILPPLNCPECGNASSVECPASDINGTRDRFSHKECQNILSLNEPQIIKTIKTAIYRTKLDTNYYNANVYNFLYLFWYYDSIDNVEQKKIYENILIDSIENHNCKISIKMKPQEIPIFTKRMFRLREQYILIDIYRRKGEFEKSIKLINQEWKKIEHDSIENNYEIYLKKQKELCLNRDDKKC